MAKTATTTELGRVRQAEAIADVDSGTVTLSELGDAFNDLLASLRAAGVLGT